MNRLRLNSLPKSSHLLSAREISQAENKTESLAQLKCSTSIILWYRYTFIHRGYYTVARIYEFYFRVAKQYFTNERCE